MILGNRFVKIMRKKAEDFKLLIFTLASAIEEWKKL